MLRTLRATAAVIFMASLFTAACGASKPPKQAEAPDALADKGADMSTGQDSSGNIQQPAQGKSGEEQMHERCCGECKVAMSKDRSGSAPNTVPCADLADLTPVCLEHFRAKKTMASECK